MNPDTVVLSIAGYDPSSGAGVTADVKTALAHGCFAATCITALTVQSTMGVKAVEPVRAEAIRLTLEALAADLPIAAVRIGMLGSGEVASAIADFLSARRPKLLVVDPIIRSSSGAPLLDKAGFQVLRERIIPLAALVTPNLDEAEALTGVAVRDLESQRSAAEALLQLGPAAVVVTGGHLDPATDLLLSRDESGHPVEIRFDGSHIVSRSTHGTGCAFATSVACNLALGRSMVEAVRHAKEYVRRAMETATLIGKGDGPVNHAWPLNIPPDTTP